jgi:hypothetical protein
MLALPPRWSRWGDVPCKDLAPMFIESPQGTLDFSQTGSDSGADATWSMQRARSNQGITAHRPSLCSKAVIPEEKKAALQRRSLFALGATLVLNSSLMTSSNTPIPARKAVRSGPRICAYTTSALTSRRTGSSSRSDSLVRLICMATCATSLSRWWT